MLKSFAAGITVGAIATLVATQYHVIRTPERVLMISRVHQAPLRSAYVDVREWNPAMWEQFPELAEAVVKAGRRDLLVRDGLARPANPAASPVPKHQVMPTAQPHPVQPTPHPYSVVPTSAPSWPQPTAHGEAMLRTARIEPLSLVHSKGAGTTSSADPVNPMAVEPVVAPVAVPESTTHSSSVAPVSAAPMETAPIPGVPVPVPADLQPSVDSGPTAALPDVVPMSQGPISADGKVESSPSNETRSWFGSILRTVIPRVTESASARVTDLRVTSVSLLEKLQQAEQVGVSLAEASPASVAAETAKAEQVAAAPPVKVNEIEPTPAAVAPSEPQVQTAAEQFPQSPRRLNVVR